MGESFYETFFYQRDDLLKSFVLFDEKYNLKLVNKLRRTNDKVEFLATVSEIHFGIFFSQFTDRLRFDEPIFPNSKLTPDWFFHLDGQDVVAEVFRINASSEDQKRSDFEEKLAEILKRICIPVLLNFGYNTEFLDTWDSTSDEIVFYVQKWLLEKPSLGDTINFGGLSLTLKMFHKSGTHVLIIGGFNLISQDIRRLTGEAGRFLDKVNKYGDLCVQNNNPFIICIYMHFESWLHPEELSNSLYGSTVKFIGPIEFNNMYPGTVYRSIEDALYYVNDKVRKSLSGVLLRYQDKYSFYPNYSCDNLLNKTSFDKFLSIRELHESDCPMPVPKFK